MKSVDLFQAFSEIEPKYMGQTDIFHRKAPTWRVIMKKTTKLALSAAAVVLVLGFILTAWWLQTNYGVGPAQEGEKEPLRILMDLEINQRRPSMELYEDFGSLVRVSLKDSVEVEVEYLPQSGPERTNALARLRTEIMAGEGPDVFICACPDPKSWVEPLFPFPEKAALNGAFLPLDEYLKKTQFMNWDHMMPQLMEGGKTESGQVIIPFMFTFHATVFDKADLVGDYADPKSWKEALILAENDPVWKAACVENYMSGFGSMFGSLADYGTEDLFFSEGELYQRVLEVRSLCQEAEEWQRDHLGVGHESDIVSETFGAPVHATLRFGQPNETSLCKQTFYNLDTEEWQVFDYAVDMSNSEKQATIIPLYNLDGGVTAFVNDWVAVNRDTKHPKEAFAVVDLLLSETKMRGEMYGNFNGMPSNIEMGGSMNKLAGVVNWGMSKNNHQEYLEVVKRINAVRFQNVLDNQLFQLFLKCVYSDDKDSIRSNVTSYYASMKNMLGES